MAKYYLNNNIIIQKIKNKITIFDGNNSMLLYFSETATFIFRQLKKGLNDENIIQAVTNKYNIAKSKAEKDVKKMIEELVKKKIVSKS